MVSIRINNRIFFVRDKISILEACKGVGIKIPRFCYHENLSIAGNCRICLVETDKSIKPVASCAAPIMNGLSINTTGPFVLKARENVLEALLLNHPLDCPICDQGGECDLQDQSNFYGSNFSRSYINKRGVENKNCGPLIKTIMVRCIQCTRCVRFGEELCGTSFLGTLNRGTNMEIGTYVENTFLSEISANVVDLCPVGALTLKPSTFQFRPWEVKTVESIDLTDGLGSNTYVNYKGLEVLRVLPKKNKKINESWISDKSRFNFNTLVSKEVKSQSSIASKIKSTSKLLDHKSVTFLINHKVDFETLNILQHISFLSAGRITIKNFGNSVNKFNFYLWGQRNKVSVLSEIQNGTCIILSSNLRLESVLLNTRIRAQFLVGKLNPYLFGLSIKSNFPIINIRINSIQIIHALGSKNSFCSKFFSQKNVVLMHGKSLADRIDLAPIHFLKKKFLNLFIYIIHTYANSEGNKCFNIKEYTNKDFKNSDLICTFFLDNTLNFRKKILQRSFKLHCYITLDSIKYPSSKIDQSILLSKEGASSTFLNLEQRPQRTGCLEIGDCSLSLTFFLNSILEELKFSKQVIFANNLNTSNLILRKNLFTFIKEILLKPDLFEFNKSLNLKFNINLSWSASKFKLSTYPFKNLIEDFYQTSDETKKSNPLVQCSLVLRETENNFKIIN
jgi:hypothetical protein